MLNIEIRKKTLKNNTRVILIRKPDYVQSFFLCGFGTGGFNILEKVGDQWIENPTGCAHFLEHQMFRYKDEDVTDLFARLQSQTNAFTSYSETAYYFSTTASIEEPLKLLLDFVQDLNITQETVEKEKGIILSEYAIYDQNPDFRLVKELYGSMYKNHPLKIDILGTEEDISQMRVEQLQGFYTRNYDPSEMVLVGITGLPLDPIFDLIEKHEENYPMQIKEKSTRQFLEEPEEVVRKTFSMDMDVSMPYLGLGYKLHGYPKIEECLKVDVAVALWLDCVFSPLNPNYQTWLDDQIISQVCGAESDFSKDHGYIIFYGQTEKIEEFKEIIKEIVSDSFLIDRESFESVKIQSIARNLRSLDHFESLAIENMRAELEGYDYFQALRIVEQLTYEDVMKIIDSLDFSQVTEVLIKPEKKEG